MYHGIPNVYHVLLCVVVRVNLAGTKYEGTRTPECSAPKLCHMSRVDKS
jgi:hypothetical protein